MFRPVLLCCLTFAGVERLRVTLVFFLRLEGDCFAAEGRLCDDAVTDPLLTRPRDLGEGLLEERSDVFNGVKQGALGNLEAFAVDTYSLIISVNCLYYIQDQITF